MINLTDVTKLYKNSKKPAVQDVSLTINSGEFFCLVGPSGCGKSTILKMIAGIENPTSGTVTASGATAMVFQSAGLFPWLSVQDNVEFGLRMKSASKSEIKEKTSKYLELVELKGFYKKFPRELSGGQRQRVGLARALAVEPEILLLDEPFSALDPKTTVELHNYLLSIWKQTGKTIVMVSHLLAEAVLLSDRVGVMNEGKLTKIFEIPLPRPRKEEQLGSMQLIDKIRHEFTER